MTYDPLEETLNIKDVL